MGLHVFPIPIPPPRALLLECRICRQRKFPASDSEILCTLNRLSNDYSVQRKLVTELFTFGSWFFVIRIYNFIIKTSK